MSDLDEIFRRLDALENGRGAPVRFDRNDPSKVTDHAVVEEMMMAWRERSPAQWGYWHATAMTGVEPAKTNRKR